METTEKVNRAETVKRYKIPQDVLMDILRILFGNQIKHKLEGVKEKENTAILSVQFKQTSNHDQAMENIEAILRDYSDYMEGLLGDRTLFMDEEEEDN